MKGRDNVNIAVIFAGGIGSRMRSKGTPKQFLEVYGKPILIYTLEKFENNENVDSIVIACVKEWIDYCWKIVRKFNISKVKSIVAGGENGQESIYNGLKAAKEISQSEKDIVLIHDGVRPLIDDILINDNIKSVKKYGSAITCVESKETVALIDDNSEIKGTTDRAHTRIARAPQSFYLRDILDVHNRAIKDGNINSTDSCTLMSLYKKQLYVVEGKSENIKITTPDDYYIFKAILQAKENSEIFA